jgi:hypothetical protein
MKPDKQFTIDDFDFLLKNSKSFREAYHSLKDNTFSDEIEREIETQIINKINEKK